MDKAILVAIDGSASSSNSLDYLARLFGADKNLSIHLVSVAPSGGDAGKEWMFDVDPYRRQAPATDKRAQVARKYLRDAQERLQRQGIAADRIKTHVKTASSAGIGAAIRDEAQRGHYDSVLIGRRGHGAVGNMFFGSTSAKLVDSCHNMPLWLVDGTVTSNRFLLAVHSQPASLMAADHLAYMLKGHAGMDICLYHSDSVFGKQQPAQPEAFHQQWGKAWCDQYLDLENFLFYAHAQLLMENGIPKNRITQLPMQMHIDVGTDLLRQAKQHNCGTIVIGRRSRGGSAGQIKGVSDRTLKQAQNIAVWLAG